jgi:hypothetical protein
MLLVTVAEQLIAFVGTKPEPTLSIRVAVAPSRYDGAAVVAAAPVKSSHTLLAVGFWIITKTLADDAVRAGVDTMPHDTAASIGVPFVGCHLGPVVSVVVDVSGA